jgi:hypothetical protein
MDQIEILKKLREDLLNAEKRHSNILSNVEALAIIDQLPRLLADRQTLNLLLNEFKAPRQAKPFYVVYSEFSLPTNPSNQYEVMSCVAAKSGEAARAEALGHISDLYGTLEHLYQSTAKFTDPNLTN